jgi:hypothetical protein
MGTGPRRTELRLNSKRNALMRRSLLGLVSAVALFQTAGCSRQQPQSDYNAFYGTVRARDLDAGEVFVRTSHAPAGWRTNRDIPCVVTKDSEIYINDRFSQFQDIRDGDTAKLVGYRDKDHFVVTFLTVARNEPAPPEPNLVEPATQAASRPTEE